MKDNSGGIHMTLRKHPKPTTRRQPRPVKLTPFDPVRYLKSDAAIAEYLNEALRVQDPKFLLVALGDVARARGMSEIARDTGLGRENLYKALSSRANPRIETIFRVAAALGVRFEVRVA
jgi:probable addiction module antidote protein